MGVLEHHPHRFDIIASEAPIALGFEVAQAQFFGLTQLDPGRHVRNLARHKFKAAARAFVVEQDARGGKHIERFAVVYGDPMAVDFGHAIGRARVKWSAFFLRHFYNFSKHFARGSLVKLDLRIDKADSFQQAGNAQAGYFTGKQRLIP